PTERSRTMTTITTPAPDARRGPVERSLTGGKLDLAGRAFTFALQLSLLVSILILGVLVWDVVDTGSSVLTGRLGDFLTGTMKSQADASGLAQGIRGTFWIGVFTVVLAFPIGIGAAIYLEEYATHGRLSRFIHLNIRNLAGVPSIVYGIVGLTVFVKALQSVTGPESNGRSVVSAGLTLAILVLPIVIITAAEAIRAVPQG